MGYPDDVRYTKDHEWAREENGVLTVGITSYATDQLGDVVFVDNPEAGRAVQKGDEVGVIESVKAAADIYAPLSGEIIAANADLADAPEKINQDPYGAWMFKLKPSNPDELKGLLDAAGYQKIADADE